MGITTASSVTDMWHILMLPISIELKHQKTAFEGSFVLLYDLYLDVQAGVFRLTPETIIMDADELSNVERNVTAAVYRFLGAT